MHTVLAAAAGVASALLVGCTPTMRESSRAALDAEASEVVATVRLEDEASIDRVAAIRHTPNAGRAAKAALEGGAAGAPRWAAVWITILSADPTALHALQQDEDASIRLMASAELAARGDASGLDGLVRLLSVEERVKGSDPPLSVRQLASSTLARFTGERPRMPWAEWLEKNRGTLRFDVDLGMWSIR